MLQTEHDPCALQTRPNESLIQFGRPESSIPGPAHLV